jgi:hypothetical protein
MHSPAHAPIHDALSSESEPEPLFEAGHPLARLVRPSFDSIRRAFAGQYVATIWVDSAEDPSRAGFRPSYDSVYGPGSANVMPCVASWLSTGPAAGPSGGGAARDANRRNVVLFPEGMDRTLAPWFVSAGLLGEHQLVRNVAAMKELVRGSGRRLYNIDDLGDDFDEHAVVSTALSRWLNSKDDLSAITAFGPEETVVDMYEAQPAHFERAASRGGRVFLKTCNTESAGAGVEIARTLAEFEQHLATLRDRQERFSLSRRLVIQPEIRGANKSFQVLLDPARPQQLQVVALTDQLVEADGKTYRSSINHPITRDTVEPVGAAILDMVDRVWARYPEAFGFLMSDYFATDRGPVLYDPGIRPTGNTATALAAHLARKLTGHFHATTLVPLPTHVRGLSWADFAARVCDLASLRALGRTGRAVVPWGWNHLQGFGMVIAIAREQAHLEALRAELLGMAWG